MANENYGNLLAEKIRANADLSKLTDYEKICAGSRLLL